MSNREAKALYDYSPTSPEEIQFFENEILIILDSDIGDGWSRGRNSKNEEGIIPSNYYKLISSHESTCSTICNESDKDSSGSDWSETEDAESIQEAHSVISLPANSPKNVSSIKLNSSFFKNGGKKFLLGEKTVAADIEAEVELIKEGLFEIYQWKPLGDQQTCNIESYKVDSKLGGLKTFVNYELISSYSEIKVLHRYNQFDWLYTQLVEKYPCIVIPQLPGRQVRGRFESGFIETRKILLQNWLNHITDHPVLSNSNAVKLFFSAPEKKKWKFGKKKVRNDIFKKDGFYNVVKAPTDVLDISNTFEHLNKMASFIDRFYKNSCHLYEGFRHFHRHQTKSIHGEYNTIGKSILDFSESLSINPCQNQKDQDLTYCLGKIGDSYQKIGSLFKSQAKIDSSCVEPCLGEINCITKEIPSILELSKGALNTLNSCNQTGSEPKLDEATIKNVEKGVQIVTRTVDAELHWLQDRRQQQMRSIMCQHLKNQIELFTQITSILNDTLKALGG